MWSWIKAFLNNHDLIQTVSEWSLVDPLKKLTSFLWIRNSRWPPPWDSVYYRYKGTHGKMNKSFFLETTNIIELKLYTINVFLNRSSNNKVTIWFHSNEDIQIYALSIQFYLSEGLGYSFNDRIKVHNVCIKYVKSIAQTWL